MRNKICIFSGTKDFDTKYKDGLHFVGDIYCDRDGTDLELKGQFYFTDMDGDSWPCRDVLDADQLVEKLGLDIPSLISDSDFDKASYKNDME